MDHFPSVTVIIPVYNGIKYIESSLKSVFSQTYEGHLQIIVVDDGSDDGTDAIVKEYSGVEYLYQENSGVSAARNRGIKIADGEYIAFLDADDIWDSSKLTKQMQFMVENPQFGITGTKAENFLESGVSLPFWLENEENWTDVYAFLPSTMIVHRSVFTEIGLFSEEYQSAEDTEWLWRARDAGIKIHVMDDVVTLRRFHGENLSWLRKSEHKLNMMKIIKESIQRKSGKDRSGS